MSALSGLLSSDVAGRLAKARGVADTELQHRARTTLLATVLLLVVGYGGALLLSNLLGERGVPKIASGLNAFTLLFIMALAIERVIQPISPFLGPDSAVSKAEKDVPDTNAKAAAQAVAKAARDAAGADAASSAAANAAAGAADALGNTVNKTDEEKKATVADDRSKTALVTWAAATGLASFAAVGLNMTLLGAVLDSSSARPPYWLDLLVTGLAVGAGTKPLNDLWTSLQSGD